MIPAAAETTPALLPLSRELMDLALALGLGLLVGLQREWAAGHIAGIRTFPLVTAFGTLSAVLAGTFGGWIVGAGVVALAGLVVIGDLARIRAAGVRGDAPDPGITTETAALVMFGVGALLPLGHRLPAIVLTGCVALLLHWKDSLHALVDRIGADDLQAMMRFVLLALVILPVLPNRPLGPYGVLNPFEIWLMVVLIVGISLGAYAVSKVLGARGGALTSGCLGGLISSTATSVSYARRSRSPGGETLPATLVVVLASTAVFLRVLFEVVVVAPDLFPMVAPPLAAMMGVMILLSAAAYYLDRSRMEAARREREPPSELRTAVIFGLLYGAVLLAVAFARQRLGAEGLYAVAALSGLTDVDAITLSTARLMESGQVPASTGWRLILVGSLSNLVFKGAAVAVLGRRWLAVRVAAIFGIALGAGGGLLLLWS